MVSFLIIVGIWYLYLQNMDVIMEPQEKQTNKKDLIVHFLSKVNSDRLFFNGFLILGSILFLGFVIFCLRYLL
jgi:hypothetical protein